jgi:hypothetical protein
MRTNDATYNELIALRDRLDARQTKLQRELEDVTRKLQSVSMTLALLDDDSSPSDQVFAVPHHDTGGFIDVSSLRGMKQVEALTKIAQHEDGVLRTATAKRLFLQAGLIKTPKNANNIIFAVVNRSGLFDRIEPGVYRLIGEKPTRPEKLGTPTLY